MKIWVLFLQVNVKVEVKVKAEVKVKVKFALEEATRTQRGEKRYSSTLSLTTELDGGCLVSITPRPLYPRERPGTHCTGDWMGLRAGLDRCGKSRSHRDSIPGPSNP